MTTWRDRARPIIAAVLRETEGQDEATIKRALRDAYPWGPRAMHPYKAWLAEIRHQRNRAARPAAATTGGLFNGEETENG